MEVTFGGDSHTTVVRKRNPKPHWNESFRFQVADDIKLQDEPLEFKSARAQRCAAAWRACPTRGALTQGVPRGRFCDA